MSSTNVKVFIQILKFFFNFLYLYMCHPSQRDIDIWHTFVSLFGFCLDKNILSSCELFCRENKIHRRSPAALLSRLSVIKYWTEYKILHGGKLAKSTILFVLKIELKIKSSLFLLSLAGTLLRICFANCLKMVKKIRFDN